MTMSCITSQRESNQTLKGHMMPTEDYRFEVEGVDRAATSRGAKALADILVEAEGVLQATQGKTADNQSMDVGSLVSVVATSGATLALAQGLAAWLRARRGATVRVERDAKSGSLKAAVSGIDPEAALRVIEMIAKK
jgi:membrane-associated two-gene conflict system component 1 (EACC1)